jgi:hypothetical protein
MIPESFTVVGGQDDERVVELVQFLELVQKATESVIDVSDLTGIEIAGMRFLEWRRR